MRHWLLALMIALLPLRGWVGDAMALSLLMPTSTTQATAAPPCHGHEEVAPSLTMADASALASEQAAAPDGPHSHSACSVCHAPALTPLALSAASPQAAPPGAAPTSVRFSSTEPRRDAKPPIA